MVEMCTIFYCMFMDYIKTGVLWTMYVLGLVVVVHLLDTAHKAEEEAYYKAALYDELMNQNSAPE